MEMITSSELGTSTKHVYAFIKTHGDVKRSDLVRKFSHRFDALEISKIVDTLQASKRISIDAERGGLVYRAIDQ